MARFYWMTIGDPKQASNIFHILFGQTVRGKRYKGLIGSGGKPFPGVKKIRRGIYDISEEQRKLVEASLKRLGIIHGFR